MQAALTLRYLFDQPRAARMADALRRGIPYAILQMIER